MCYERKAWIVTALSPVRLLGGTMIVAYSHSRGTPPPCRIATTVAWNCSSIRWLPSRSPPKATLSSSAGISSGPPAFRFHMLSMVSSTSKVDGKSSRGVHGDHTLSSSTIFRSSVGDFILSKEMNHCTHRSRMSPMSRSQLSTASYMYRELHDLFSSKSIP